MNISVIEKEEVLHLLNHLKKSPQTNQRILSKTLGTSLGKVNFILKELGKKGWIKIKRASQSKNKLAYIYILTPEGIKQKTKLTSMFLKRKIEEYNRLKKEIEKLELELENMQIKTN
ncbi:MAG: MarR family EPS-associated transcriptional regulator [bacterium]|nr:MarR family EPS-associated transcriptional regulator [bacterium]